MADKDSNESKLKEEEEIKTMKLYSYVERIYTELKELGYSATDPLSVQDVNKFDQYHYHGTEAIDKAIHSLNITSESRILDIGSGLGGPARYLASKTRCHVTAIELQGDLNKTALDLTKRCQLDDKVRHIQGNFLELDLEELQDFDSIVSWLVFLHIPDKRTLLQKCYKVLKPGGTMYIEDYFRLGELSESVKKDLEESIYTQDLISREDYCKALENAGFAVEFEDVSQDWWTFVDARYESYKADRARHVRLHGEGVYKELEYFYRAIARLLNPDKNVGGCRITAHKPATK